MSSKKCNLCLDNDIECIQCSKKNKKFSKRNIPNRKPSKVTTIIPSKTIINCQEDDCSDDDSDYIDCSCPTGPTGQDGPQVDNKEQ